uniref:Uncharacterized protein n=1 Tax=Rhizophora mucronata TaxID=61149 RepID=A0A2P2QQ90_RHIMU
MPQCELIRTHGVFVNINLGQNINVMLT